MSGKARGDEPWMTLVRTASVTSPVRARFLFMTSVCPPTGGVVKLFLHPRADLRYVADAHSEAVLSGTTQGVLGAEGAFDPWEPHDQVRHHADHEAVADVARPLAQLGPAGRVGRDRTQLVHLPVLRNQPVCTLGVSVDQLDG